MSSLQVGGMEQFVLRIAKEQERDGHESAVIGLQGGPLMQEARRLGLEVRALGGSHTVSRVGRAALTLAGLRPDVAHAHNPAALPYALLAKLSARARIVMTRHGQGAKRIGGAFTWRHTDAVVAVSEAAAAALRESNPSRVNKISVIHNGVHLDGGGRSKAVVRTELGLDGRTVGIMVARVDPMKGHGCLVQALAMLDDALPLTILLVGDGPDRAKIESQAEQMGLTDRQVRFLGFRSDVPDLLGASDFFILPSLTEGLPLALLEAMAHRLPVIATPVGGIPEVVLDGEQGLLIPVDDPAALAQAIARLAGDAGLRRSLGEAAYSRAGQDFSFAQMARRYEELYYRLCS